MLEGGRFFLFNDPNLEIISTPGHTKKSVKYPKLLLFSFVIWKTFRTFPWLFGTFPAKEPLLCAATFFCMQPTRMNLRSFPWTRPPKGRAGKSWFAWRILLYQDTGKCSKWHRTWKSRRSVFDRMAMGNYKNFLFHWGYLFYFIVVYSMRIALLR